jgi:hypothetical protein
MALTEWNVSSECISSLAYDDETGEAVYTFVRGGGEYRTPMSIQRATAWAFSSSPGEYFNANIKGVFGGKR